MSILKIPKEPCYTDECLVRAACRLIEEWPWQRLEKCEMYKKHREKELKIMRINNFFSCVYEFCIGVTVLTILLGVPTILMSLGIWKGWELAKPFIERILS